MKKYLRISFIFLLAALMLAGCKKDKEEDKTQDKKDKKKSEATASDVKDEAEPEVNEAEPEKTDDSESMKLYEAFLNGTEKTGVSRVNLISYLSEDNAPVVDATKTYTMEELLECFFNDRQKCFNNSYKVDGLKYAFVDCGKDGERELVLKFDSTAEYDGYSNIFVIKNISGKLELCYFTEDGYRSYNYVNADGVIASGGSGGASVWYDSYRTINADGNVVFIYDVQSMGAYNVYIDGVSYGEIAEEYGIEEDISVFRYSFEDYNSDGYDEEKYNEYLKNALYTYCSHDSNYEMTMPAEIYEPSSPYAEFMSQVSDNVYSYDDMQGIIKDHLAEFNLTENMIGENDPEWMNWEGHDDLFASTDIATKVIAVFNPSWEYYTSDYPYDQSDDFVTLSEVSHVSNDIIDEEDWFNEIGVEAPVFYEIHDPSGQYTYYLSTQYGVYDHQFDTVTIHNNFTDRDETILDFSNFIMPDEVVPEDVDFVRECVNYIQIVDGIAYISIAHRTYASSAPHNAYVMALDVNNDFAPIWKSEPLTCNADNFAIVDGSLICGYGFTAEPDYIYILNRYTGERMNTIKVKTGPDYFYAIDGMLYVRTYDTNYVFKIEK